jgi:hypothetical protein
MTDAPAPADPPEVAARPLHLILAVWGEPYIRIFLDITVPSLLAPGNVPALGRQVAHRLRIFTPEADWPRIAAAPVMQALARHLAVEHVAIPAPGRDDKYRIITRSHQRSLAEAEAAGAAVVFLSPDFVLADGCLRTLGRHAAAPVVLMSSPRAALPGMAPGLAALRAEAADAVLAVPPRRLMGLAMAHPHAVTRSLFWSAPDFTTWPSILMWQPDPETWLARVFHAHPILVDPARLEAGFVAGMTGTIDGDLIDAVRAPPGDIVLLTDSDDFLVLELSGPGIATGLDGAGPARMAGVVRFVARRTSPTHRALAERKFWYRAGPGDSAAQQRAAFASDRVLATILATAAEAERRGGLRKLLDRALHVARLRWSRLLRQWRRPRSEARP